MVIANAEKIRSTKKASSPIDWPAFKRELLQTCGEDFLVAELTAAGLEITNRRGSIINFNSLDNDDQRPSGFMNLVSGQGGDDSGGQDGRFSIFDLFGKLRGTDQLTECRRLAELKHVPLPGATRSTSADTAKRTNTKRAAARTPSRSHQTSENHLTAIKWREWVVRGHRGQIDIFKERWLATKPGISYEAFIAAGGRVGEYKCDRPKKDDDGKEIPGEFYPPQWGIVYGLPIYGESALTAKSADELDGHIVGYVIWSNNHKWNPLTVWNSIAKTAEPIKMKVVGSADGIIGRHGLLKLIANKADPQAAVVRALHKVEGPTDLLALYTAMSEADRELEPIISTAGGSKQLRDWMLNWFIGHHVIASHDADKPGQKGATKWCDKLIGIASSVRNVIPFDEIAEKHGLDLRDLFAGGEHGEAKSFAYYRERIAAAPPWMKAEGLAEGEDTAADDSSEEGDEAPDGGGEPAPLEVNEAVDDPHRLARLYIENCASHDGALAIRRHREEWKKWNGRDYRTVTQEELQADLCRFIKEDFDRFNLAQLEAFNARDPQADDFDKKAKPPQALKVTRFLTSNVMAALQGYCTLDSSRDPPFWTMDNPPHPANEMVSTESGLIHIPSLANGSTPWRFESTPEFFSPNSIAVKFQDDDYIQTRSPLRWFDFLDTIFPDAPDQVELLREWFGYTLLPDTSMQKMLLLVGPKRSGKGTICRILTALVGILNVVNPRLSSFATDFGLEQLIGKTLAIITDARLSGRVDISQIAEVLLSISGEDRVTIARKYKTDLSCRLPVRFMIVSNELPAIMDSSGAFASRCVLLQTGQSFLGREDRDLEAALLAELPGIFVWAAQGWQQLQERGRFEQPESSSAALDELKGISAPIQEFLREECTFDPEGFETVTDLFRRWEAWCKLRGINPSSSPVMGRNLLAASSKVKSTQPHKDGVRVRGYGGIRLINGLPT